MFTSKFVELRDVRKSFRTGEVLTEVLRGVDLNIEGNSFFIILGPSGCGKTTLLNLIGALDLPDSGSITVDGHEISNMRRAELTKFRRENIGFVFQFYNLLPTLTALENIEVGLEITDMKREDIGKRAMDYLEKVGLNGKENKFPGQLSGGEQQRVAIARALAREPKIVLADEPTGNLDAATGEKIIELMRELGKNGNRTFIIVTHNQKITEFADRAVMIVNGRIV